VSADTHKGTVLVVDDDEDIRAVLTDLLDAEGYQPVAAENGREALDTLQRLPRPCLVLLDVMMPVMDGHEFLRHVRARPELVLDVRVVVCTASTTPPAREPPVLAILEKPFETSALVELLARQSRALPS